MRRLLILPCLLIVVLAQANSQDADLAATWNKTVDKAIGFLRKSQAPDGSFSGDRNIGITGLVVTGLLNTGKVTKDDPMVKRALEFIEKQVDPQAGHVAGKSRGLKNYITAVNMMALGSANSDGKYNDILKNSAKFITGLQWDDEQGIAPTDPYYGGFGYDGKLRPDVSNTAFALEALRAAGVPSTDPVFKRTAVYLSRAQDRKGEQQDQTWPDMKNDGAFIYVVPNKVREAGSKKGVTVPGPGYASITYAGVKSMIYAGVAKDDPRIQQALTWIKNNYSVENNTGQPAGKEKSGLFFSYHTMSKALSLLGLDSLEDSKGVKHDWRKDLILQLAKTQLVDGSWTNSVDRFMEGDPNLVTGFALMALSNVKPK
ncbi:MAG: terpene cyclase/mutase family protein [Pirellulales bacterium]